MYKIKNKFNSIQVALVLSIKKCNTTRSSQLKLMSPYRKIYLILFE